MLGSFYMSMRLLPRQAINFAKTNVSFNKVVKMKIRNRVTMCLDIREILPHDKYLGLPTAVG